TRCVFSFHNSGSHQDLPSFPTRRSSDLQPGNPRWQNRRGWDVHQKPNRRLAPLRPTSLRGDGVRRRVGSRGRRAWRLGNVSTPRSEEHTSELQSRENLVCRLLLEKKKTN